MQQGGDPRMGSSMRTIDSHVDKDKEEFSGDYDETAPPVGPNMAGHDTFLMGPKVVMLDSFVVDLLNVDTGAQTFRLKLMLNIDWEDDGTIEPEVKAKRVLGRVNTSLNHSSTVSSLSVASAARSARSNVGGSGGAATSTYKTGKYVLREEFRDDPLATTWNPELVLANAIADEDPIEAGSKMHCVQMLGGRPLVSRSVLYQPECRCEFTFDNFPFDETDLVVKFGSNKWNSEQVQFIWSQRLGSIGRDAHGRRMSRGGSGLKKQSSFGTVKSEKRYLERSVDHSARGGIGLSEFEIIKVRVETDERDVNSMQRYDNAEGAFSQAHLIIRVRRDPYSYLLRVATVAELLMFLEVLSFVTDCSDLSARFSISGTNFLAMVSLYGPMADALPKVSVVTRVDKWHLFNFVLLFLSNVENLVSYVIWHFVDETRVERYLRFAEALVGAVYLYYVVKNLKWFLKPLQHREEYMLWLDWFQDMREGLEDRVRGAAGRVCPWLVREREGPRRRDGDRDRGRKSTRKAWARMGQAAIWMKNAAAKKEEEGAGQEEEAGDDGKEPSQRMGGRKGGGGVKFDLRPKRH